MIDRIGGMMSLLEGHGDVTMTRAAGNLVPHAERYARVLAASRAQSSPLNRLLMRLTGMEGKLNRYATAQRFIAAAEAVGEARVPWALLLCWTSPAMLPSIDEIRDPQQWLRRTGRCAANAVNRRRPAIDDTRAPPVYRSVDLGLMASETTTIRVSKETAARGRARQSVGRQPRQGRGQDGSARTSRDRCLARRRNTTPTDGAVMRAGANTVNRATR